MRLSNYLLPVLKEDPAEAQIPSHRLMLRAGMVRQLSAGIYNWLPLGLRVLRNIEQIVREEMDAAGAQELLMPTMQPAELWEESGRGSYGKETLTAEDRHGRTMIYGPTNEEVITDIARKNIHSYKELPRTLYHIQWKFRDEIRPRFGVMRGREFLMKDAYSFDLDKGAAEVSYHTMFKAYLRIFKRIGLSAIPFQAETGKIGGSLSHEFQVVADTGESEIFYDKKLGDLVKENNPDIKTMMGLYSAADEKHDAKNCTVENLESARGIEVGHIFYLGSKYSEAMGASYTDENGKQIPLEMGCYGIGISRLVGAVIEASHDENGIIWPASVAPFHIGLINVKTGDDDCDKFCDDLYQKIKEAGVTVLYDDRKTGAGTKFATMDLIGLPWQIAIGPRGLKSGMAELKNRVTGEKQDVPFDQIIEKVR